MSCTTWTQGNWVDSWLLVVGSQVANLTPNLSFGHNLCFRCPNRSYKPILDIYVSIAFQWYKEFLSAMGFDHCNHSLKIRESTRTPTPNMGAHLGVWMSILTLFPHSRASLLARTLASPCLGCKPKARIATITRWTFQVIL